VHSDYACDDYPVCGVSVHDRKLLMNNEEGGKISDFVINVRTKSSVQLLRCFVCMYVINNHRLFMYRIYYK
jgi:hypothetical protein